MIYRNYAVLAEDRIDMDEGGRMGARVREDKPYCDCEFGKPENFLPSTRTSRRFGSRADPP